MINKVKDFLTTLFEKEQLTLNAANFKARFDEYNSLASELKSYMGDMTVGFGLPILTRPNPDFFYQDNAQYPNKRYLYKISEYNNKKYGKLWLCYVSESNPDEGNTKLLSNCFIVAQIGNDFKIIAQFNPDYDTNRWSFRGGDETIDFYKLGNPTIVERFISPTNDDWSIEEYYKNK